MAMNLGPSPEFMKKFGKPDTTKSKAKAVGGAKHHGGERGGKKSRLAEAMKKRK